MSVTQDRVSQLAKQLVEQGEKPTIGRIRDLLGYGSPNTISRYLKVWREGGAEPIESPKKIESSEPSKEPIEVRIERTEPQVSKAPAAAIPVPSSQAPKPEEPKFEKPIFRDKPIEAPRQEADSSSQKPAFSAETSSHSRPPQSGNPASVTNSAGHPQKSFSAEGPSRKERRQEHSHPGNNHRKPFQKQGHPGGGQRQGFPNSQGDHSRQEFPRQEAPRVPVSKPALQFEDTAPEVYVSEQLDTLTTTQLIAKVRRLESILNKEVSRRERADALARNAKEYAEAVKGQIGARINEVRESMEMVISQLESQLKSVREQADRDMRFYRDMLEKAQDRLARTFSRH